MFANLLYSFSWHAHFQTPPLQSTVTRARLFCTNCDSSNDDPVQNNSDTPPPKKLQRKSNNTSEDPIVTSTPACVSHHFTPEDRKSMSPITRSTQRMTRAMQVKRVGCCFFFVN